MARIAARRGDHITAVAYLGQALAHANVLHQYFDVRRGGKTRAAHWLRVTAALRDQIQLCEAFISSAPTMYVRATGISAECIDGEYRKVTPNDND